MDRYIYDYDLFECQRELPYCDPTDYKNCEEIEFIDISDEILISGIKSSFLSATSMPNIVQYDRLNDDKSKDAVRGAVGESDFQEIHEELLQRGFLERDLLIDFEYLKDRTKKRMVFPEIVHMGMELHPLTFIVPKSGIPKMIMTKDFIANPIDAIN